MSPNDPYRHHPGLRGKIRPAAESFFRDLDLEEFDRRIAENGMPEDWRTPDAEREAKRHNVLEGRWDRDLWVFAFGSLMWDPAMEFAEVLRGRTEDYERRFCLIDTGGRGSVEHPALQLAIDDVAGAARGCDGLAFRIEADRIDHETFVLFRREMISHAYRPVWLQLDTVIGRIEALAFAADHSSDRIDTTIPVDEQARMIAKAEVMLVTNAEYLTETRNRLAMLDLDDPYVTDLCARVASLRGADSSA